MPDGWHGDRARRQREHPASYLGRVGALIEAPAFWPGLGVENLRVLSTLGRHDTGRIPEVLDLVGLGGRGSDRFGSTRSE